MTMEKNIDRQLELIKRGTVEIIQLEELKKKIENAIKTDKPLIIKAGFDPTAPDIHLGHTVLLRKMRHFQELGHKVIFLIGDATALVGDPSGQSQTRKVMTYDEVEKNASTYEEQIKKILKIDKDIFERRHNSQWFLRVGRHEQSTPPFTFEHFVELAQRYTVARLLERDDFEKRMKENKPISFLELFYPLMQGYDSVKLRSDVELGGSDQKFNMLVGRDLQQAYGQDPQVVVTMPLLEGLDGVQKMSKSLGNYVGINESAKEIFGKLMSISDELMYKYYELLTDEDINKIRADVSSGKLHPKDAKVNLAKIIVSQYHSKTEADKQSEEFDRAFKDKGFPSDIQAKTLKIRLSDEINITDSIEVKQVRQLVSVISEPQMGLLKSRSEAKRKIQEGAVEVDGMKITDISYSLELGKEYQIRVGKKFARVLLK